MIAPDVAPSLGLAMLAAGLSFLVAAAWRGFALRRQLLDAPDPRRLHTQPTPRGGGIAIAAVMLLALIWTGSDSVAFLADGNSVASSGRNKQIHVWQTADAKEVRKIGDSLVKSLTAVYHGRVKYPDQETA